MTTVDVCKKIQDHILVCKNCKTKLDYDPYEKALLKSYSIKNDIMELLVYIITGIIIIYILHFIVELKVHQAIRQFE
jgi:hypothetical protein